MTVLGLGVPRRRPFRQPQFRSTSPGLPLLACQPVSQGVNQVIVGELVVLPARCGRADPHCEEPSGSVGVISRNSLSRMWVKSSNSLGRFA